MWSSPSAEKAVRKGKTVGSPRHRTGTASRELQQALTGIGGDGVPLPPPEARGALAQKDLLSKDSFYWRYDAVDTDGVSPDLVASTPPNPMGKGFADRANPHPPVTPCRPIDLAAPPRVPGLPGPALASSSQEWGSRIPMPVKTLQLFGPASSSTAKQVSRSMASGFTGSGGAGSALSTSEYALPLTQGSKAGTQFAPIVSKSRNGVLRDATKVVPRATSPLAPPRASQRPSPFGSPADSLAKNLGFAFSPQALAWETCLSLSRDPGPAASPLSLFRDPKVEVLGSAGSPRLSLRESLGFPQHEIVFDTQGVFARGCAPVQSSIPQLGSAGLPVSLAAPVVFPFRDSSPVASPRLAWRDPPGGISGVQHRSVAPMGSPPSIVSARASVRAPSRDTTCFPVSTPCYVGSPRASFRDPSGVSLASSSHTAHRSVSDSSGSLQRPACIPVGSPPSVLQGGAGSAHSSLRNASSVSVSNGCVGSPRAPFRSALGVAIRDISPLASPCTPRRDVTEETGGITGRSWAPMVSFTAPPVMAVPSLSIPTPTRCDFTGGSCGIKGRSWSPMGTFVAPPAMIQPVSAAQRETGCGVTVDSGGIAGRSWSPIRSFAVPSTKTQPASPAPKATESPYHSNARVASPVRMFTAPASSTISSPQWWCPTPAEVGLDVQISRRPLESTQNATVGEVPICSGNTPHATSRALILPNEVCVSRVPVEFGLDMQISRRPLEATLSATFGEVPFSSENTPGTTSRTLTLTSEACVSRVPGEFGIDVQISRRSLEATQIAKVGEVPFSSESTPRTTSRVLTLSSEACVSRGAPVCVQDEPVPVWTPSAASSPFPPEMASKPPAKEVTTPPEVHGDCFLPPACTNTKIVSQERRDNISSPVGALTVDINAELADARARAKNLDVIAATIDREMRDHVTPWDCSATSVTTASPPITGAFQSEPPPSDFSESNRGPNSTFGCSEVTEPGPLTEAWSSPSLAEQKFLPTATSAFRSPDAMDVVHSIGDPNGEECGAGPAPPVLQRMHHLEMRVKELEQGNACTEVSAHAWKDEAARASEELHGNEVRVADLRNQCAELSRLLVEREHEQAAVAQYAADLECKMGLLDEVRGEQAAMLKEQKVRLSQLENQQCRKELVDCFQNEEAMMPSVATARAAAVVSAASRASNLPGLRSSSGPVGSPKLQQLRSSAGAPALQHRSLSSDTGRVGRRHLLGGGVARPRSVQDGVFKASAVRSSSSSERRSVSAGIQRSVIYAETACSANRLGQCSTHSSSSRAAMGAKEAPRKAQNGSRKIGVY